MPTARTFIAMLAFLSGLSSTATAGETEILCGPSLRWTRAEQEAFKSGSAKTPQSPAIREFFRYEADSRHVETSNWPAKKERISWEDARNMIMRGWVRDVMQFHSQEVWLLTTHGTGFVAHETRIDEVVRVVDAVDPCGVFIHYSTE